MRDVRVATVQFQHAPGDKAYNLGRVRHFVTEAARQDVEIIAFPEMCLTGYWHVRKLSRAGFEALAGRSIASCTSSSTRTFAPGTATPCSTRRTVAAWVC